MAHPRPSSAPVDSTFPLLRAVRNAEPAAATRRVRDADCLKRVAGIAMREVQRATAGASTGTAAAFRSGGVLFVHRFGATLNAHVHLHLCMLDGVVAQGRQGLAFRGAEVDEACVQRVQTAVRQRVLGLFERRGLLSSETVGVMQGWGHSGGFSVHAGRSAG